MSDQIVMHGPVSTELKILVINDETNRIWGASVGVCVFRYPTQADIKARLEDFEKTELPEQLPGFRLATKQEAWEHFCMENAGGVMAMPSGPDWDAL